MLTFQHLKAVAGNPSWREAVERQSGFDRRNAHRKAHTLPSRQDVQFSDTMHKSVCPVAARHASKLHDIMQGLHGLARSRLAFL